MTDIVNPGDKFCERMEKEFGEKQFSPQGFLSTGCLVLDLIMGGGYPKGQFVEISGEEGAGKTLIGTTAMREAQRNGGWGILIEAERKFREDFANKIGLTTEKGVGWYRSQPNILEEALKTFEMVVDNFEQSNTPTVILLDSIAALCGLACDVVSGTGAGQMGIDMLKHHKRRVAEEARIFSDFFKRSPYKRMSNSNIILIGTNQVRSVIGRIFGEEHSTPGGRAIRHNAIIRLRIESKVKVGNYNVAGKTTGLTPGIFIQVHVIKNQIAPPFRKCLIPVFFDYGIDDALASLLFLQQMQRLEYKSGRFKFEGKNYFKLQLRDLMWSDPTVYNTINELVRETYKNPPLDLGSTGGEE